MKRVAAMLFAAVLTLLPACGGVSESSGQTVSVNGSTSVERVILTLAERYMLDHPETKIVYDPTGTGAGLEALQNGVCDIALASRTLAPQEEAAGLQPFVFALDGIAVLVNGANPVENLTVEQLAGLYTGRFADWSDVGGKQGPAACIGRESGSGTRDGFETATGTEEACILAQELTATGAVLEAVRNNPQAVGYASLASVEGRSGIRILTIDGVACTEKTILNGSYALQRPFVFVTQGELNSVAKAFFDWAASPQAASYIRQAGAIPTAGE